MIVAPAILTNAASVLVISTSNRLARAVYRARELSKQLEMESAAPESQRRLRELGGTERRALLLLQGLQSSYLAIGGFALATLISLLGAVIALLERTALVHVLEAAGVLAGMLAVAALVRGAVVLLRETRIAVQLLRRCKTISYRAAPSAVGR